MVLLVLALIWAVVLVPRHVRHRAENRPGDSVGAFQRQLSVLGGMGTSTVPVASNGGQWHGRTGARSQLSRRAAVCKRRRDILLGLAGAALGALVLGFVPGLGALHAVHLVLDVLLGAYLALLVRCHRLGEERKAKVRHLPATALPSNSTPPPQPAMLLRRYGS